MARAKSAGLAPLGAPVVPELKDEPMIREVFLRTYRIVVLTVFEGHRKLRSLRS